MVKRNEKLKNFMYYMGVSMEGRRNCRFHRWINISMVSSLNVRVKNLQRVTNNAQSHSSRCKKFNN